MTKAEAGRLGDKLPGARARLKKMTAEQIAAHAEKMRAAKKAKAEEAMRQTRALAGLITRVPGRAVKRQPNHGLTPALPSGSEGYGEFKAEQYVECTCDGPKRPDPQCPRASHRSYRPS